MPNNAVYLPRQSADGFVNMAVDEYLLELCRTHATRAALRFYEWQPPAVSLGYSQSFDLLDLAECREQRVDVVRRITGGGAILHCQELTYCFVLGRDPKAAAPWPRQTAAAVSRSLLLGLSRLGVRVSARQRTAGTAGRRGSELCFASGVENEIEAGGRKLAGCAHKFTREAFFSHGSVMTGSGHVRLARLVRPEAQPSMGVLAQSISENSVSLSELTAGRLAAGELEAAFKSAFEDVFGLQFVPQSLSGACSRVVEERAAQKRSVLAAAVQTATPAGGAC